MFVAFCGWFADKSPSRRLPLLIGLLALAGSTVMLCVGSSITVLVLGRVFQGFSAAIVWCVGLALLVDTVGQKEVGKVMGYVSISITLATLVAPLLGGVVYARAGYYAVFGMAFGLLALDIVFRAVMIEKKIAQKWLDSERTTLQDNVSGRKAEEPQPAKPQFAIPIHSNFQESIEEDHGFCDQATQATHLNNTSIARRFPPILRLLGSRRILAALWAILVQAGLLSAFDTVLPLYLNQIFGWNSLGAGLIFLPIIIPNVVAPFIGILADKYGPRWLMAGGLLLATPFYVLLRLVTYDDIRQKVLLCALLALIGVTLTLTITPILAEIAYVIEAKEKKEPGIYGEKGAYAQAYGLFNTAFAAGTLIGPIWAGFVLQKAGWGTMSWTLGLLSGISAVPVFIWTGGLFTRRNKDGFRADIDNEHTPNEKV